MKREKENHFSKVSFLTKSLFTLHPSPLYDTPLNLPCASGCFPIINVLIEWRPSYHVHKILSTTLLDRETMRGTRYLNSFDHLFGPLRHDGLCAELEELRGLHARLHAHRARSLLARVAGHADQNPAPEPNHHKPAWHTRKNGSRAASGQRVYGGGQRNRNIFFLNSICLNKYDIIFCFIYWLWMFGLVSWGLASGWLEPAGRLNYPRRPPAPPSATAHNRHTQIYTPIHFLAFEKINI